MDEEVVLKKDSLFYHLHICTRMHQQTLLITKMPRKDLTPNP